MMNDTARYRNIYNHVSLWSITHKQLQHGFLITQESRATAHRLHGMTPCRIMPANPRPVSLDWKDLPLRHVMPAGMAPFSTARVHARTYIPLRLTVYCRWSARPPVPSCPWKVACSALRPPPVATASPSPRCCGSACGRRPAPRASSLCRG